MRGIRWWCSVKLFHLACKIMPASERKVMMMLMRIGTQEMKAALDYSEDEKQHKGNDK